MFMTTSHALMKCDLVIHKGLYANVVRSGNAMMYLGVGERGTMGPAELAPSTEGLFVASLAAGGSLPPGACAVRAHMTDAFRGRGWDITAPGRLPAIRGGSCRAPTADGGSGCLDVLLYELTFTPLHVLFIVPRMLGRRLARLA